MLNANQPLAAAVCVVLAFVAPSCHRDSPFGPGLSPRQEREAQAQARAQEEAYWLAALQNADSAAANATHAQLFRVASAFRPEDNEIAKHNRFVAGYPISAERTLTGDNVASLRAELLLRSNYVATSAEFSTCLFEPGYVVLFTQIEKTIHIVISRNCRGVLLITNSTERPVHLELNDHGQQVIRGMLDKLLPEMRRRSNST